jgi:hypothetical protein
MYASIPASAIQAAQKMQFGLYPKIRERQAMHRKIVRHGDQIAPKISQLASLSAN